MATIKLQLMFTCLCFIKHLICVNSEITINFSVLDIYHLLMMFIPKCSLFYIHFGKIHNSIYKLQLSC